jgi:hypothetical protein
LKPHHSFVYTLYLLAICTTCSTVEVVCYVVL